MTAPYLSILKNPDIQAQLLRKVSEEVAEIEQVIRESTHSKVDLVQQVSKQMVSIGAKLTMDLWFCLEWAKVRFFWHPCPPTKLSKQQ